VLAAEAGVSAPATSAHLAKLVDAGLITAERSGCHRYHLAGTWGVAVTAALVERGALPTTDGLGHTGRRRDDPYASVLREHPYELGPHAHTVFARVGLDLSALERRPGPHRPGAPADPDVSHPNGG
jgi:DNA-binding transcriptional ArsR family regulator